MRLIAICLLCVSGLLVVPTDSLSKKSDEEDKVAESWDIRVNVDQSYTDNVKWSSNSVKEGEYFTTIGTKLEWNDIDRGYAPNQMATVVRARFYDKFKDRDYVEIVPEFGYEVGKTDISVRYSFIPRKLLLDEDTGPNNNLPPEDIFSMRHRLSSELQRKLGRGRKWRVTLKLEGLWVRSTNSIKERDSFTPAGGVELRYRFAPLFVPRVKVQYGERDTHDNNFNREELDLVVGFDSQVADGIRWQFRYKRGARDYTVGGPQSTNSNNSRNDDSDQYRTKLEFAIPGVDGLGLVAHYKYRKNHSSRASRNFSIQEGGLDLSYTFR